MEVVDEPSVHNNIVEEFQVTVSDDTAEISCATGESFKSNGIADDGATADVDLAGVTDPAVQDLIIDKSTSDNVNVQPEVTSIEMGKCSEVISTETVVSSETDPVHNLSAAPLITTESVSHQNTEYRPDSGLTSNISDEISDLFVESTDNSVPCEDFAQATESLIISNAEAGDTVTFKTEVLVERNENDVHERDQNEVNIDDQDASKHILSALRQNLELSDVLHSDVTDNMENNNSSAREEVLNKEELLDILEGNDVDQADDQFVKIMQVDHTNIKTIEAQLALQQLTRLKSAKNRRSIERLPRRKKSEKKTSLSNTDVKNKIDKNTMETSVDESDMIAEDNKSRKDKRNLGASSKTTEISPTDNKTHRKDKKSLETPTEGEQLASTELKSKNVKQSLKTSNDEVDSNAVETKSKRNRKMGDNVKVSDTLVENNQREICNSLINDATTLETGGKKANTVKENIVNVLVKDWDDDEHEQLKDATERLLEETEDIVKSAEELPTAQEIVVDQDTYDGSSVDSSMSIGNDGQAALNKSGDEGQPQRRLGRVIKKKVIFDPDNPDTFTKGKQIPKNKEPVSEKDLPTSKKIKVEVQQQIPKAKSPTGKLQWKKPPPKANKQNKRLTEVDKLLMDEGAVNMIYQLTPEAPKGKKNMRTKAEFIKKIQSSTPDGKEMKFRERKKESIKGEEAEAKKIVGGKQRGSLSSSVKSMSICEDFEAHSADDSIIYRRHSSSSYSSNCMSPLRANEPDTPRVLRGTSASRKMSNADEESVDQSNDVFMAEMNTSLPNEVINKTDCLSIKQKLNSKLSHVLNKRKRESTKTDKPAKQKRVSAKHDEKKTILVKNEEERELSKLKTLTVTFDHNLAEIFVLNKEEQYSIQTLKDLELALAYINSREDISVTLIMSECGTLCSSLDLSSMVDENIESRTNNIFYLADCLRSLMSGLESHGKLVVAGAWGACGALGLALAALSDVAVASQRASFALAAAPACLGLAAVAATRRLPKPLVDELVVFGRAVPAAAARAGGLLAHVVWPAREPAQLRALARDLAAQPRQVDELVVFGRAVPAAAARAGGLLAHVVWPAREPAQLRALARDLAAQPRQVPPQSPGGRAGGVRARGAGGGGARGRAAGARGVAGARAGAAARARAGPRRPAAPGTSPVLGAALRPDARALRPPALPPIQHLRYILRRKPPAVHANMTPRTQTRLVQRVQLVADVPAELPGPAVRRRRAPVSRYVSALCSKF